MWISAISPRQARDIYKRDYWDRVRGDDLTSQLIAENLFDTAVNMGVRTASRLAQSMLNISPADGIIGSASLGVINKQDEKDFIIHFTLVKIGYYANLCNKDRTQSKFLLGWVNRALGGAA